MEGGREAGVDPDTGPLASRLRPAVAPGPFGLPEGRIETASARSVGRKPADYIVSLALGFASVPSSAQGGPS